MTNEENTQLIQNIIKALAETTATQGKLAESLGRASALIIELTDKVIQLEKRMGILN